jgi:general secretion pathway protein G
MQRIKRNRRRRGGFTLLEVLLVVGIIALLAAAVVPQFMGTQRSTEIQITENMVASGGTIAQQLELYRMAVGSYPDELRFLVEKPEDEEAAEKWNGPYIDSADKLKDAWGNELKYKHPGDVNEDSYDLWSIGPDEEDGTDDDITNYTKE